MTPEEFRVAGHALVDWIADFRTRLPGLPVQAAVAPGDIRAALPKEPPTEPDAGIAALLADLDRVVVPGMTHIQHPRFHGFFPANASLASVLGDMASSGLGGLGIAWQSCPALTEVEEVVVDWMRQLVGLSTNWRGTIQDTASTACLVALLIARERATAHSQTAGGLQAEPNPLTVYTTAQAHSSVMKAALLAGYGRDNLRMVATDAHTFAMRVEDLIAQIEHDRAGGMRPAAIVCAVGTTATTAVDPVKDIVEAARASTADTAAPWVHVDAAMAGSAMLLPECRHLWEGVEGADSLSWNPHKWMGTILDTSLFYVRDVEHLVRVMSTNPAYLRSAVDGEVTQYRDWGIPLGRRFRALKLWFHLRLDGPDAIRQRIRRDLENAQWLKEEVERTPQWHVLTPVPLQTVCVRHEPPTLLDDPVGRDALDRHTLHWSKAVNDSGGAFLTPSLLDGRWMVRVSLGAETQTREDVAATWALMQECADAAAR